MSQTVYLDPAALKQLTRIADALERAFPKPKSDAKLVTGVAHYNHDDPQTQELKRLAGELQTPSDRPTEKGR